MSSCKGGNMRLGYYVLGAVGVIVAIGAFSMIPDLIRYMKIRSM